MSDTIRGFFGPNDVIIAKVLAETGAMMVSPKPKAMEKWSKKQPSSPTCRQC